MTDKKRAFYRNEKEVKPIINYIYIRQTKKKVLNEPNLYEELYIYIYIYYIYILCVYIYIYIRTHTHTHTHTLIYYIYI